MIRSTYEFASALGVSTLWIDHTPTFGELLHAVRIGGLHEPYFDPTTIHTGVRRSARIRTDELADILIEECVASTPFSEGKIHKVEDVGDDTYTIFKKGKGKKLFYALFRNAEMLIDWKPSPRDAETRIQIERMRFMRGKSGLQLLEDSATKRLKQIPEWGMF